MFCVCGHDRTAHQLATMSVPLVSTNPKAPYMFDHRNKWMCAPHPHATYEQLRCTGCGCCQYDADFGD